MISEQKHLKHGKQKDWEHKKAHKQAGLREEMDWNGMPCNSEGTDFILGIFSDEVGLKVGEVRGPEFPFRGGLTEGGGVLILNAEWNGNAPQRAECKHTWHYSGDQWVAVDGGRSSTQYTRGIRIKKWGPN